MTPAEVYMDYVALTRHFTSDYDYHKYCGKLRLSRKVFDDRPDRWIFEKLSRKQNPKWMIIAGILAGKKWIGEMASEEAEELAARRLKNVQSLAYVVKSDLERLGGDFDGLVAWDDFMPRIVTATMAGEVQLETLTAVAGLIGCHEYWLGKRDPVLDTVTNLVRKYEPFMQMDRERIRKTVVDSYRQTA